MTSNQQSSEVIPEISFVFNLIKEIKLGKMLIPKFQRKFIWTRDHMLDLLSSIRRQYPIGSILIWETSERISSNHWFGKPDELILDNQTRDLYSYVLDGQQRLSTLFGVLEKDVVDDLEDPERWKVWFNAKSASDPNSREFEYLKSNQKPEAWHFPMSHLLNTFDYLNECSRILNSGHVDSKKYIERIQEISQIFNSYKMPVLRMRHTTLYQAVDIFSRLNFKGQTMSADQMLSALTYSEGNINQSGFNLSDEIDSILLKLTSLGFGDLDRAVVLRALLIALEEDMYRSDWTNLSDWRRGEISKNITTITDITANAMENAVNFLHTLGVKNRRLLPYAVQLLALTAFYIKCSIPTSEQKKFLERWFWVTSFTARFSSSNPSRDAEMVAEFRDVVSVTKKPIAVKNMNFSTPSEPFPLSYDMRSARTRTLLLVILSLNPLDNSGKLIEEPSKRIDDFGPEAFGKIISNPGDRELNSSPANRILRLDFTKNIQAKTWLLDLKNLPDAKRVNIIKSHGVSEEAFEKLVLKDPVEFLKIRLQNLIDIEKDFMASKGVVLPSTDLTRQSAIDADLE